LIICSETEFVSITCYQGRGLQTKLDVSFMKSSIRNGKTT